MAYIDVPTNTDCVLDGMVQITEVAATCNLEDNGAVVFTLEDDGAYRMAMAGIGAIFDTVGMQFILRNSVSTADDTINNDGIYEVEAVDAADAWIEVVKPDWAWNVYDDAAAADFDEIDTFIFHPEKRTGQLLVYVINSADTDPEISFKPGGYWASKPDIGAPVMQGKTDGATKNLFQIETAPYLQTEEEDLGDDEIQKKGTILMRLIPATDVSGATVKVAFIELA